MRTKIIYTISILMVFIISVKGEEPITIGGSKFTNSLIEKWINEYKKENPQSQLKLVSKKNEAKQIDISIIAHQPAKTDLTDNQQIIFVCKYALLPITGKSNSFLKNIKKRGLNKKEFETLFFKEGLLEENNKEKTKTVVNIYSRESQASSSIAFANYFGHQPNDIRGKKILGDDIFLFSAIKKDSNGITFNNLGYIYDLQTRKVQNGISVLPLDINKEAFSAINNNIDDVLNILESNSFETIPVIKLGFIFNINPGNKEIIKFLKWVIADGQKYNHDFGFLNLDKELQANQIEQLSEKYLTATK